MKDQESKVATISQHKTRKAAIRKQQGLQHTLGDQEDTLVVVLNKASYQSDHFTQEAPGVYYDDCDGSHRLQFLEFF